MPSSRSDEYRSGRPLLLTTSEMINRIHDMVLSGGRRKLCRFGEVTCISHSTEVSNCHEKLFLVKLVARWMPRLLAVEWLIGHF